MIKIYRSQFFMAFLIAVQFLTRLPVNFTTRPADKLLGLSVLFYPLIGLIIGLCLYLTFLFCQLVFHGHPGVNASIILGVWVFITGALHLDGLADTADGFLSGQQQRDKIMAIMKDSRSGVMGVVSIVIILLSKFALLMSLISVAPEALLIAPFFARLMGLLLISSTDYVQSQGIAAVLHQNFPNARLIMTELGILLGLCLIAFPIMTLAGLLVFFFFQRTMQHKIQGYTGDTAGAMIEISETMALAALLAGVL